MVSGYFDPIHVGHLEYLQNAKKVGGEKAHLIVIVNNDEQAALKKGKAFMPGKERVKIVEALRCVDEVHLACDKDRTCVESIRALKPVPHMFCNGGDQTNQSIPEAPVCNELGIELVDGLGDKIQSSSWLIKVGRSTLWRA